MGFLAPWFLAGMAALGVPVFVHLLRKHTATPRPVGSLMFFERGTQSSTRHRQLKHLLLFALRAALILMVVAAFASPFVRQPATNSNGRILVIALDHSFSMQAGTRFADAKREALALLLAKPQAQKAQVIALGGKLEILTQPIADSGQLRSALESIQPGDGRASFGDIGHGMQALANATRGPIDLHLFSDLQRTAMPANFADMVLPANVKLILHEADTGAVQPNWTVESVSAPAELSDPKDPRRSRVQAVIAGYNSPAAQKSVSLVVNGKTIATRKVSVPANGRATVEFAPLDVGYGFNRCEVRVEGGHGESDAFPGDDGSVFTVKRSDPERVLFVHSLDDRRSAIYFGAALNAAAHGSFILQSVSAEEATDLDPEKYAFVVLSDVLTLPAIFQHTLEQDVAKGSNVLVVLGTHAAQHAHIPIWGGDVANAINYARRGGFATVASIDFTHPALQQAQPGRDRGGWAEAKVFYAASVDARNARVAAQLADGTPLLLDRRAAEGRVLLFTSGFDGLTNDLPLHPVFVSLVDQTTRYLSGAAQFSGSQLVDSFVQLRAAPAPEQDAQASVEVIGPNGRRPLSLNEARTAQSLRLERAGFYQIRFANGRDAVIGVNPDRRESDLRPMDKDLQQLWSGNSAAAGAGMLKPAGEGAEFRTVNLWWYVMLLALALLAAESVVASGYMATQREEA